LLSKQNKKVEQIMPADTKRDELRTENHITVHKRKLEL